MAIKIAMPSFVNSNYFKSQTRKLFLKQICWTEMPKKKQFFYHQNRGNIVSSRNFYHGHQHVVWILQVLLDRNDKCFSPNMLGISFFSCLQSFWIKLLLWRWIVQKHKEPLWWLIHALVTCMQKCHQSGSEPRILAKDGQQTTANRNQKQESSYKNFFFFITIFP